jgi:uncharacterized protein YjbI with pentapeptide repeats
MRSSTSQDRAGPLRWFAWALAGVAGIALLAGALWLCIAVLPQRLYPSLSDADLARLSPADQAARREGRDKLQNDARTTLLQGLAALLVLSGAGIGAAVTFRQVRISREQLVQARQEAHRSDDRAREQLRLARDQAQRSDERLREQVAVAQEGQITERFTRAVDQLGQPRPDQLDVRLGGIYALERIAHDSPTHRLAVVEILTAFIRTHAPWPPRLPGQYRADAPIEHVPSLQARAPDIQAALTVIGRRPTQEDDPPLDLDQTDLRKAHLIDADLTRAELDNADLTRAQFMSVDLTMAWLLGVNLTEAQVTNSDLTEAHLIAANLTRANLGATKLRLADLGFAKLGEASLRGADLTRAWLLAATLTKAQLQQARLTGAWLGSVNLREARLNNADLTEAWLAEADLTRAQLSGANLIGAQFRGGTQTEMRIAWTALTEGSDMATSMAAELGGANLTEAQFGGANLTEAQLNEARATCKTVWPDGWDRSRRVAAGIVEPDKEGPPTASSPG